MGFLTRSKTGLLFQFGEVIQSLNNIGGKKHRGVKCCCSRMLDSLTGGSSFYGNVFRDQT